MVYRLNLMAAWMPAERREVFAGELGFRFRVGKLREQPLIELDGVVLAVLFVADLGEAEEGGCGEVALLGVAGEKLLVVFCGGVRVAGDFLGVEAITQQIAKGGFFRVCGCEWEE